MAEKTNKIVLGQNTDDSEVLCKGFVAVNKNFLKKIL